MNIEYQYCESSEKPLEVDAMSSATVVYLRKNIRQIAKESILTGEPFIMWAYDEAQITHQQYEQMLTPMKMSKTAYIGDTEVVFKTEQQGNLTVFVEDSDGNYPKYTVERMSDRIIVKFDALEKITNITISII